MLRRATLAAALVLAGCASTSRVAGAPATSGVLDAAALRELSNRLATAPRRAPGAPLAVAVLPAQVAAGLAGVDGGALAQAFARELRREPSLEVTVVEGVAAPTLEQGVAAAIARGAPPVEVWLWLAASPAGAGALAVEVESWTGDGLGRKGYYRTEGAVAARAHLVGDAGDELRHALVHVVGPTLPVRGAEQAIRDELLARPRDAQGHLVTGGERVGSDWFTDKVKSNLDVKHDCTTRDNL
ncbi:MAG: hypothetical protein QM704_24720 [Anaeromyxobacteraceae bacterium]